MPESEVERRCGVLEPVNAKAIVNTNLVRAGTQGADGETPVQPNSRCFSRQRREEQRAWVSLAETP